ncbi:MAG: DUF7507 domain-containing protein, partial [Rhodococcus sp. (in: high G+C Gram-positive bacteria)]
MTIDDVIYYWLTVKNDGNQTLTNVTIDDTLPAAGTEVSDPDEKCTTVGTDVDCDGITLAPGASYTYVVSMAVPDPEDGSECGPDLKNKFTFDSTETDASTSNEVVADLTDCDPQIEGEKSQSEFNTGTGVIDDLDVEVDDVVYYWLKVTNNGNQTLTNVTIDDTFVSAPTIVSDPETACDAPVGNALNCDGITLEPGESYTVVVSIVVPETDAGKVCGEVYKNSFTYNSTETDEELTSNEVDIVLPDCVPNVKVDKDDNEEDNEVEQGGSFTYTVVVWNEGNDGKDVYLSDTLTGPGTITSVVGVAGDPVEPACVIAGDGLSFLCGPFNVPAFTDKADGFEFTVTVEADGGIEACGVISNRAYVHHVVVGTQNPVGAPFWTGVPDDIDVVDCGDPYVEKSVFESVSETEFGQLITYNITIGNNGNYPLDNVLAEDNLTNGVIVSTTNFPGDCFLEGAIPTATGFTCDLELDANESVSFSITVKVSEVCLPLDNEIHLVFGDTNPNFGGGNLDTSNDSDNTGNGVTVTGCLPSVDIDKTPTDTSGEPLNPAEIPYGGSFEYSIIVTNTGNADAVNVQVTDLFTGNGTITGVFIDGGVYACESALPAVGGYDPVAGFTCQLGTLGYESPNNSIEIRVRVQAGSGECADIENSAVVFFGEEIDAPADRDDTDNTVDVVDCLANPAITKELADGQANVVQIGEQIVYTVEVTNTGNAPATHIDVVDSPTNATVASAVGGAGVDCAAGNTAFPCHILDLAIGQTVSITVTLTANDECLPVENVASLDFSIAGG